MRFEAREIRSYAEPASAEELRAGEVYFAVNLEDPKLPVPFVKPVMFLGRNLEEGDIELLYFQSFETHAAGVRFTPHGDHEADAFHARGPEDLNHIFEYEKRSIG